MKKFFLVVVIMIWCLSSLSVAQVLETEESKPLLPGQFEIGTGLEYQTSSEGTETAMPFAFEYGLTKRFTVLVEPVPFTIIHSNTSHDVNGVGDIEATLFYQILTEKKIMPSVSLSGEIKIPTAQSTLIGTGKTDFTPYMIASKKTGRFFSSINLSYTFLGRPSGVQINNVLNYAAGTIFTLSKRSILFGEIYGNTSAVGEGETPEGQLSSSTIQISELSGGETVGAFGYGFYIKDELLISLGINYDNNSAWLFRPGIEWKFGGKRMIND